MAMLLPGNLYAFKPKTHVHLAEIVLHDALDDGYVTIFDVDYSNGRIKKDAAGKPIEIGRYKVRKDIFEACSTAPNHFRAGVIGPDAYPDILTGQQLIHPAGRLTPGETDVDLNRNGSGPDPWLTHLWKQAFESSSSEDSNPRTRAFVIGYLFHAAGDIYAHTFVNHYAGGAFHFAPDPQNALKHIVLEGYVATRTEAPSYEVSIDGIQEFLYRNLVYGEPGSALYDRLLIGDNAKLSIPAIYSRLRATLVEDIDSYEKRLQKLEDEVKKSLAKGDVVTAGLKQREATTHKITNAIRIEYKKRWRDDIDRCLPKWVDIGHRVAIALSFNSDDRFDWDTASEALTRYGIHCVASMSGSPDAVGDTIIWTKDVLEQIGIEIPYLEALQKQLADELLKRALGKTADELRKYLTDPGRYFNDILDDSGPTGGHGQRIDKKTFDLQELRLSGDYFDPLVWQPAFNTTVLCKMIMMERSEVDRLMADIGSPHRLSTENAMLEFAETLDGSQQWVVNPSKMIAARYSAAYRRIFMLQTGETPAKGKWHLGIRYAIGPTGCRITFVEEHSAAAIAELQADDIIVSVDGCPVGDGDFKTDRLDPALESSEDQVVDVVFLRKGVRSTCEVRLSEQ